VAGLDFKSSGICREAGSVGSIPMHLRHHFFNVIALLLHGIGGPGEAAHALAGRADASGGRLCCQAGAPADDPTAGLYSIRRAGLAAYPGLLRRTGLLNLNLCCKLAGFIRVDIPDRLPAPAPPIISRVLYTLS